MPETLAAALAAPGLVWLALAAFVAGLVRGFSGFGSAMVYLPVAGQYLSPLAALVTLVVMDAFGPIPNVPRALRDADRGDLARMVAGALVGLPVGLAILLAVAPEVFRYTVSLLSLALLICLALGLRYRGRMRPPLVYGVGGLSGLLGGAAGISGPPVVLFYMASPHPPRVIRANILLYLLMFDLVFLVLLAAQGRLAWEAVMLGLVLAPAILGGNMLGAACFRPEAERLYRWAAYGIIALAALSGLPLLD